MFINDYLNSFRVGNPGLFRFLCWALFFFLLFVYGRYRRGWWRKIFSVSLDYHKFHLAAIQADKGVDEKTREFAIALLWAINKQLPVDLGKNGGGKALWLSFLGEKTALNTCGAIFYESSRFMKFIDLRIVKLNDTLLSTFYRIFFLESIFLPIAVPVMDIRFFLSMIRQPKSGASRLYLEMKKEISCEDN